MNLETTLEDITPMLPDPVNRAREVEELVRLSALDATRESSPSGPWDVVDGTGILISAPHQETHFRDGAEKIAERGTGPLALALARYSGGAGIATAPGQSGDPNWDIDHAYVRRADGLDGWSAAIDIHMMRPRGIDICIGLGPVAGLARDLWMIIAEEAVVGGLRVSVNWPFGGNARTVTGQLQNRGRRAIQLELSWECFDPAHPAMLRAWSSLGRATRRLAEGPTAVT